MKHLWIPLLFVFGCGQARLDSAPTAPEPALQDLARNIESAWDAHGPEAWEPLLATETTLVDPMGHRADGKDAVLGNMGQPGPTRETSLKLEIEAVQWLSEDTVLIDAIQTLTGPGVEKLPSGHGRLVAVAVREDGTWRLLATRPYIPVQR